MVEQHLAVGPTSEYLQQYPDNPFSGGEEPVECAILDSATIEKTWGFVFFYQSKKYVETGDFVHMLCGNAPLVVLKTSGDIYETGTAEPIEHYLRDLEGWLGEGATPRVRPDVEVELFMASTSASGRQGPAFSGYRPSFAVREDYLTSGVIDLLEVEAVAPGQSAKATITFLTPSVYPRTLWVGRILPVHEGAKMVGTAKVVSVFNQILAVDAPLYEVLLSEEVIGRSPLRGRDPSMGIATGTFVPTYAFTMVEDVFALFAELQDGADGKVDEVKLNDYYTKRDKLDLKLRSPEGMFATEWIHITDYRSQLGPDACELEVCLSHSGFFQP